MFRPHAVEVKILDLFFRKIVLAYEYECTRLRTRNQCRGGAYIESVIPLAYYVIGAFKTNNSLPLLTITGAIMLDVTSGFMVVVTLLLMLLVVGFSLSERGYIRVKIHLSWSHPSVSTPE